MHADPWIQFTGGRQGTAAATWGQYSIWTEMEAIAPHHDRYNVPVEAHYEHGIDLGQACRAVHHAVAFHESLRTRLSPVTSTSLEQVLAGTLRLPVRVIEVSRLGSPRLAAQELRDQLRRDAFDVRESWPVRVGMICQEGRVYYTELIVSHHAADEWAALRLRDTLLSTTAARSAQDQKSLQPYDEAEFQESAQGQRICAAAEDHWRNTLRRAPLGALRSGLAASDMPRHQRVWLTSIALPPALEQFRSVCGVSSSTVLLAAFVAAIATVADGESPALLVQAHNRFRRDLRSMVGTVTMPGIFLMNASKRPFSEMVLEAWQQVLQTYRFAYYDKRRIDAVKSAVERERSGTIDLSCWLNDRRTDPAPRQFVQPRAKDMARRLKLTKVELPAPLEKHGDTTIAMRVNDVMGAIRIELIADNQTFPTAQLQTMLREMELMVVENALGTLSAHRAERIARNIV